MDVSLLRLPCSSLNKKPQQTNIGNVRDTNSRLDYYIPTSKIHRKIKTVRRTQELADMPGSVGLVG